jgi:hypothetical protein
MVARLMWSGILHRVRERRLEGSSSSLGQSDSNGETDLGEGTCTSMISSSRHYPHDLGC